MRTDPAGGVFELDGAAVGWGDLDRLLWRGLEYRLASTGFRLTGSPSGSRAQTEADALERLRATGWDVDESAAGLTPRLVAHRGDLVLLLWPEGPSGGLQRTAPRSVVPAGIAAGLAGAALGWLVFAWGWRRTAGPRQPWSSSVAALFALTMLLWCTPALFFTFAFAVRQASDGAPPVPPLWAWLGQPACSLFFLAGCFSALIAALHAARPWPRISPRAP